MGVDDRRSGGDMPQPETLEGWTLRAIKALLEADTPENERLDWKERFPKDGQGHDRLVQCIVGMANNGGGVIVFGVTDHRVGEQRLVGIDVGREFGNQFENFAKKADPPVPYAIRQHALGEDRWIQVVQISSRAAPHSFGGTFFTRRGGGCDGRLATAELRQMFISTDVREAIGLAEIDKVAFRFNRLRPWPEVENNLEILAQYACEGTVNQKLAVLEALRRQATFVRNQMSENALLAMFNLLHEAMPHRGESDDKRWRQAMELVIGVVGHIGYDVVLYLQRGPAVIEVARLLSKALLRANEKGEPELAALAIEQFIDCEEAAMRAEPDAFQDAAKWLEHKRTSPSLIEAPPPKELLEVEARLLGVARPPPK